MHLINPLACGVNGAESGSATIYKRGTTTGANWYSDFEGASASTGDVALDSNGGAQVYVNELVTVKVYSAFNQLIRTFTAGVDSPAVEVKSQSFTGTDYTTATSAAGNPTTLQAALDLWKTSSGTTDFNVLVNGSAIPLSTFSSILTTNVYNVKTYGATGDGTTDDSSTIQAALDAANTAGSGIVFFPTGTYFIATQLDVYDGTTVLGAGKTATNILVDADISGHGMVAAASSVTAFKDFAIYPDATRAGSINMIRFSGSESRLERCRCGFNSGTNEAHDILGHYSGDLYIVDCELYANLGSTGTGANNSAYASSSGADSIWIQGCKIATTGTGTGSGTLIIVELDASVRKSMSACLLDASSVNAASVTVNFAPSSGSAVALITACSFIDATASSSSSIGASGARFAACAAESGISYLTASLNAEVAAARAATFTTDNSGTLNLDPAVYHLVEVSRSDSTAQTVNFVNSSTPATGQEFIVIYKSNGGAPAITWGTGVTDVAGFTLGLNKYRVCRFIYSYTSGGWFEAGTSVDTA